MSETAAASGSTQAMFEEVQHPHWGVVALGMGATTAGMMMMGRGLAWPARVAAGALTAGGVGAVLGEFFVPMVTTVAASEIEVRFGRKTRFRIPLRHVREAYAREVQPMQEFGGWGIRRGLAGYAFSIRGNRGVQLVLRSGRRLLIGSADPIRLEAAIREARLHLEPAPD